MKIPKDLKKKKKPPQKDIPKFLEKKKTTLKKNITVGNLGPMMFEQMGNTIWMKNTLDPKQYAQFKEEWIAQRPKIKQEIINSINELKELINTYNPLDFLDFITIETSLTNPETFKPFTDDLLEIHSEYAHSFITANYSKLSEEHPSLETCQKFQKMVQEIILLCTQYYMREEMQEESKKSIRFQSIISFLNLRGESYENHHTDLIKVIFTPFNVFFQKQLGFNARKLIEMTKEIQAQRLNNFLKKGKLMKYRNKIIRKLNAFLDEKGIDPATQYKSEIFQEIYNNEEIKELREKSREILFSTTKYYNEINLNEKVEEDLIDLFSMELGCNSEFLDFTPNWPLNSSLIYRKPFLKVKDKYYGFGNTVFFRNLIRILESLISNYDQDYFNNVYMAKKAKVLEDLTIKYFQAILLGSKVYQNLFYDIIENGVSKRVEVDVIIIYDKHLFIVESKANNIPLSARRGSIVKIKTTLNKILDKAYQQAIRCKKYIDENPIARFEYKNGKLAVEIKKEDFEYFYIINTTMERLRHLSIQLDEVKQLDLLKGEEEIWTVFINDLRIISEINDCPSIFLLYLQRRKKALQNIDFMNQDEIELYGHFLKTGLYYPKKIPNLKIQLFGQMRDIDEYYMSKVPHTEKKIPKPFFNIADSYLNLVRKIEDLEKPGFSIASMFLLRVDKNDQDVIRNFILEYGKFSLKTGRDYKCVINYSELNCVIELVVRSNISNENWEPFIELLELGMYKFKCDLGILYMIVIDEKKHIIIDFKIKEEKWKFDSEKQRKLKKSNFKEMKRING